MPRATIHFVGCEQGSQELGTGDEHMVARVDFEMSVEGERIDGLSCEVKQTVGEGYEDGRLEVGPVQGLNLATDYQAIRDAVEQYYRSLVGAGGLIDTGGARTFMTGQIFRVPRDIEVDLPGDSLGW